MHLCVLLVLVKERKNTRRPHRHRYSKYETVSSHIYVTPRENIYVIALCKIVNPKPDPRPHTGTQQTTPPRSRSQRRPLRRAVSPPFALAGCRTQQAQLKHRARSSSASARIASGRFVCLLFFPRYLQTSGTTAFNPVEEIK
jgi:hypothetical protein